MVSTLEPRKNHIQLIAAWEKIRSELDSELKIVFVGSLGWEYQPILRAMRPWIESGDLFLLSDVPASDLRVLYRHASITVCPSFAEGFDFSGIESMGSGGIVIASNISVHTEVYGDAALYFDPYCTSSLVKVIKMILFDKYADLLQNQLRTIAKEVVANYSIDAILPQWLSFLESISVHENNLTH